MEVPPVTVDQFEVCMDQMSHRFSYMCFHPTQKETLLCMEENLNPEHLDYYEMTEVSMDTIQNRSKFAEDGDEKLDNSVIQVEEKEEEAQSERGIIEL
jgi:hypothetical protein